MITETSQAKDVRAHGNRFLSRAQRSVIGTAALAILISIHHLDELGISVLIPAVLIISLPPIFMWWFLKTNSQAARWIYGIFVGVLILGFGGVDGGWNHTAKVTVFHLLGADRANMAGLPFPPVGSPFHEITGVLTFLVAIVATYLLYQFMAATREPRTRTEVN